jgi:hypothetical protein
MIIFTKDAHAYLDPGTGSMVLQGILAALLTISTVIGIFWTRIKSIFIRSNKEEANDEPDES